MSPELPAIGTSLQDLDTPALVIDLDRMEANIRRMQSFFDGVEAKLRPHVKTHKAPGLARRQIEAGARGVTCAKLGEGEAMVEGGITDILIANQVVGEPKVSRLVELCRRAQVTVAVDDPENIRQLDARAREAGVQVNVLVELDVGGHRCGVQPGREALELTREVLRHKGLRFRGLMGYEGFCVLVKDRAERKKKAEGAMQKLLDSVAMVRQAGIVVEVVSCAGTGTYDISGALPGITEVQAGSYILMDSTYSAIEGMAFEQALSLVSQVVSLRQPRQAVIDAGLKTLTAEFGTPTLKDLPGAHLQALHEEHGIVRADDPNLSFEPGQKVEVIPSHVCTTCNLHDAFIGVRDGRVEEIFPITARGRST